MVPIKAVFDAFIGNCKKDYSPSEKVTIDEQLVTFRDRCRFKMYIPS